MTKDDGYKNFSDEHRFGFCQTFSLVMKEMHPLLNIAHSYKESCSRFQRCLELAFRLSLLLGAHYFLQYVMITDMETTGLKERNLVEFQQ